jgi:hypothetical protein
LLQDWMGSLGYCCPTLVLVARLILLNHSAHSSDSPNFPSNLQAYSRYPITPKVSIDSYELPVSFLRKFNWLHRKHIRTTINSLQISQQIECRANHSDSRHLNTI